MLVLLTGSSGCDSPTAPELLQRLDQATRELAAPGSAASAFGQYVLYAARIVPPERIDSVLTVSIDGRTSRYSAVAFERIVVRVDPSDGYPCPLTSRTLAAYDGGVYALLLRGSDFTLPMRTEKNEWCLEGFLQQEAAPPHLKLVDDWLSGYSAIIGTAQFDDAGLTGPCDFLYDKAAREMLSVTRIDCEIREYVVAATARLARSSVSRPVPPLRRVRQVSFPPQRVVGIRLTVYCRQTHPLAFMDDHVGGCEHTMRWQNVNVIDGTSPWPIGFVP